MKYRVYDDGNNGAVIAPTKLTKTVTYVTSYVEGVVEITTQTVSLADFKEKWKPTKDYPVEKLAELFWQFSIRSGISTEALGVLGSIINLNEGDAIMADTKTTTKKAPAKKSAAKTTKTTTKKAPAKKPAVKKDAGPTAAGMFRDMIMEGNKTDDQIFAAVQKKFDLDDSKRKYVAWYRNQLKKQGKNPPEAKK